MPIITTQTAKHFDESELDDNEINLDALLFSDEEQTTLTLEGTVISDFLESVDFEDLFDDEVLSEYVEAETLHVLEGDDVEGLCITDEAEEGSVEAEVQVLDGELLAEMVDDEDLYMMFEHYAQTLPEESLSDKMVKATAFSMIEPVDEAAKAAKKGGGKQTPFQKGDFVNVHNGTQKTTTGKTGSNLVSRMIGAMLTKQAIARRKPNQVGYTSPESAYDEDDGTYTVAKTAGKKCIAYGAKVSGAVKYGAGKASSPWKKYKKTASAAKKSEMMNKKVKGGMAAATQMKAAAKKGDGKKKAAASIAMLAKSKAGMKTKKVKKAKKKLAFESVGMTESHSLTARMCGKPITEDKD